MQRFRPVTVSRKDSGIFLTMHQSGWLYLQYKKQACFSGSLPRASSSPVFFKALAVSCFFPATSKPPSYKHCWGRTSNKSTWPRVARSHTPISLTHMRARSLLLPPQGNTSLTSPLARKSYLSCGRRFWSGLILDGCFQVLRFTTSLRSFKRSTKGWKPQLQRRVSPQVSWQWSVWCASWKHKAMTWMQLFRLRREHQWIVRALWGAFVVDVSHFIAPSRKQSCLSA